LHFKVFSQKERKRTETHINKTRATPLPPTMNWNIFWARCA